LPLQCMDEHIHTCIQIGRWGHSRRAGKAGQASSEGLKPPCTTRVMYWILFQNPPASGHDERSGPGSHDADV
jgi:hypothetical protein